MQNEKFKVRLTGISFQSLVVWADTCEFEQQIMRGGARQEATDRPQFHTKIIIRLYFFCR